MRPYDDELYTLSDQIKRRRLFQPLLGPDELALFDETRRPERVVALNLTEAHFREAGATQVAHLKQDTYDLLAMLYNGAAFATGSKARVTTTTANATAQRRRGQALPGVVNEGEAPGDQDALVDETDRHQRYLQGGQHLAHKWETVLRRDEHGLKVVAYRLVFFDRSVDGQGIDLLTKGVQECQAEATQMQFELQAEQTRASKAAPKRGAPQTPSRAPELKAHYRFCRINTHPMFLTLCANHFALDDLLWQQAPQSMPPSDDAVRPFIDRRAFLQHNRGSADNGAAGQDAVRFQRRQHETLPLIFSKESAMVYHVESAGALPVQRCVAAYCTERDVGEALDAQAQNRGNAERLAELFDSAPDDREFARFPLPQVTYSYDMQFCCAEMLPHLPLPHRLGTYLYTHKHRDAARRRVQQAQSRQQRELQRGLYDGAEGAEGAEEEEDENMDVESGAADQPLGLHDVELEVTPELLHTHAQYISEDVLKALSTSGDAGNAGAVPANIKASFLARAANDINMALMRVVKSVAEKKTYLTESALLRTSTVTDLAGPTEARLLRNWDKEHALDRRVAAVVGRSERAKIKDRQQMLAVCNLAYHRQVIGKWRPIAATVDNVKQYCRNLKYEPIFLARDIYWVLDALNTEGFANLDRAYFNPLNGRVRAGKLEEYLYEKRLFYEAITAEFWHEFFHNPTVPPANDGIRRDLQKVTTEGGLKKRHRVGVRMSLMKYDKQVLPFHSYMLWMYSYFTELCGISRLFKPMNIFFHNKYHHCRTYPPGTRAPKNNTVALGHGMVGKSWILLCVRMSCPTDVVMAISHWTAQCFNTDTNFTDVLMIQDEMSQKLLGMNAANKSNAGHSDAGQDDARNNAKERATAHESTTAEFYRDEETGQRRMRISKAQNQFVMLGASNVAQEDIDPNVLSRFICLSVARSTEETIGNRPQDKTKLPMGQDGEIGTQQIEEVREVHRLYYMTECAGKSGALRVSMNAAEIYLKKCLDLMSTKYGINTNNVRKRTFITEEARILCLAKACWWTLKSPEERHLFYDPYTREYIGLNPRVLLDGVAKHLVVQKQEIVMALTMLSGLWSHEHEERVLETFALKLCRLDQLDEKGFLQRAADETDDTTALQNFDRRRKQAYGAGMDLGGGDTYQLDCNYVRFSSKTRDEIYRQIVAAMPPGVCVTVSEVSYILRQQSGYLLSDAYVMRTGPDGKKRLEASGRPENIKKRKIVDVGKDARTGNDAIAISVAFLKQKLSHLLKDDVIADVTVREYDMAKEVVEPAPLRKKRVRQAAQPAAADEVDYLIALQNGEEEEEPPTASVEEDDAGDDEPPVLTLDQLHERLRRVIVIERGSAADTPLMKVIREVLEHDILQWTGEQSEADERQDWEDYADVVTGRNPCMTFVTADAPPPQQSDILFPDMIAEYRREPGYNKELRLDSAMAVLELERKRGCRPFVTFNFNTVSESARSALSVYNTAQDDEADDEATILSLQRSGNAGDATEAEFAQWRQDRRAERERDQQEARAAQLVIAKNQYKMYSESPLFYSDVDLDYDECKMHLLSMAFPESVARRNGRLCNFEPHMYYNMMDYRDARERHSGKTQPLVPMYADVVGQVATQRRIIEGVLGRTPLAERKTYSQLCGANYEDEDLRAAPGQRGPPQYVRRDAESRGRRAQQKADAMACMDGLFRLGARPAPPDAPLAPPGEVPRTQKSQRPTRQVDENPRASKKQRRGEK
jgi:hypothetical protein